MAFFALFWAGCSGSEVATDGPTDAADAGAADEPADDAAVSVPPTGDGDDPAPVSKAAKPIDLETPTVEFDDELLTEREPIAKLKASVGGIEGAQFSPEGSKIYATNYQTGFFVLDGKTYEQTANWQLPPETIDTFELSADGSALVSSHLDGKLRTWETKTGSVMATYDAHKDDIKAVAISPDGKTVVSAEFDELDGPWEYVAWDAATGKEKWRKPTAWRDTKPVAFAPDGKTVALWDDKGSDSIAVCNVTSGETVREIKFKHDVVMHISYAPDGASLLVALPIRRDGKRRYQLARIGLDDAQPRWIATTGIGRYHDIRFSPDGSLIAISGGVTRVFDAGDGTLRFTIKKSGMIDAEHLSFSSDGKLLITSRSRDEYEVFETSSDP